MKITATGTDDPFSGDAQYLDDDAITKFNLCEFTQKQVRNTIDNLNISADAKVQLYSFSETSIDVVAGAGKTVIWIGRKIMDVVIFLVREFPNASFGVIFCAVVGHLIGLIPIIGFLFGPLIGAIMMAFGLVHGTAQDLRDKNIERRLAEMCGQFSTLKTDQKDLIHGQRQHG